MPPSGLQKKKRADGSETDEGGDEREIEGVKKGAPCFEILDETVANRPWEKGLPGGEGEQGQDEQTHRVVLPAFEEHASNPATQAASQSATGAGQMSGALEPADGKSRTVGRANDGEQKSDPGDEHTVSAQPEGRGLLRLVKRPPKPVWPGHLWQARPSHVMVGRNRNRILMNTATEYSNFKVSFSQTLNTK
jgi:hypothetical protein